MNKSILILGIVGLFLCFSCNNKKSTEEPKPNNPDTIIYDGSISSISTDIYDSRNDDDTAHSSDPVRETVTITVCNLNILADEVTEIKENAPHALYYAMDSRIPAGNSLRVVLRSEKLGDWSYNTPENWKVNGYIGKRVYSGSWEVGSQAFDVIQGGTLSHLWVSFYPTDEVLIEFYENGSTQPSKTKMLKVKYTGTEPWLNPADSTMVYPEI